MKKVKLFLAAIASVAVVVVVGGGYLVYNNIAEKLPDNLKAYLSEDGGIMDKMMKGMEEIATSGIPAVDFLNGMIPHHEGAIDMAKSYIENGGNNEALVKIANDIINVQSTEIADMTKLIDAIKNEGQIDSAKAEEYLKTYSQMFMDNGHGNMGENTAKSIDEAFANGMIAHHEMAIKMAEDILKFTNNNEIIKMAENIIRVQKEEVNTMKEAIKK